MRAASNFPTAYVMSSFADLCFTTYLDLIGSLVSTLLVTMLMLLGTLFQIKECKRVYKCEFVVSIGSIMLWNLLILLLIRHVSDVAHILFSTSIRWRSLECLILMISAYNFIQCTYNVQREVDSGLFWFSIVLPNQII